MPVVLQMTAEPAAVSGDPTLQAQLTTDNSANRQTRLRYYVDSR